MEQHPLYYSTLNSLQYTTNYNHSTIAATGDTLRDQTVECTQSALDQSIAFLTSIQVCVQYSADTLHLTHFLALVYYKMHHMAASLSLSIFHTSQYTHMESTI